MNEPNHDLLLLAALLLNRHEPMAPHHVAAVRERLGYATDAQLLEAVQKGVPPNAETGEQRCPSSITRETR